MSTLTTKHVAAVFIGVGLLLSVFAFATPAKAYTIEELQALINQLVAQIAALQAGQSGGSAGTGFTFTRNHSQGDSGGEVMEIQKFLNAKGFTVAASGAGSPGNESSYFGPLTKAAVVKFQNQYASDILAPVGLSAGTGYWGPSSRTKANNMNAGSGTGTGTGTGTPTTPTTGVLSVYAGSQPAASLAPESAASVPFTTVTVSNGTNAAVTINSVTVERVGLAQDAVFSGLILLDNGMRTGNTKTLNSNHQAVLDANITLQPGQSRTLTVAGDMAATLDSYAGQVVGLNVIAVNTSAAVSGSLPIAGTSHTINSTLSLGSLAMSVAPGDPDTTTLNSATAGKEIGTTNYTAAEVRATAGSTEDIWVKSIRWNMSGSASAGDLANVKVVVDGTDYPMTIDSTGKYYSASFPGNGLEIVKGAVKDFTVKVDIIGGPARTVRFDLYRAADIHAVGEVYGYAVTPTQSESGTVGDGSEFTSGTPFFSGTVIQINTGSVTSVSRANEVPAQNIVENTSDQPLGGFVVDIKGESITVQQTDFFFTMSSGAGGDGADIDSVTLVDQNGLVVAGPTDATQIGGTNGRVRFTDTITYPTGRNVYTLKGKIGTDFANGDTIQASTTPSSDWTTVRGVTTGDTISLSTLSTAVTGNTMTVRAASVALSPGVSPAVQTIVAGSSGIAVASFNFDATQSGEDVRFTSQKFNYDDDLTGGDATNCYAYDGATRLNSSVVNPTTDGTDYTFTFDSNLVVAKGTTKVITIKCDIPSSISSGSFSWDIDISEVVAGTGLASGQSVTPTSTTGADQDGNTQTIASSGALTIVRDSSAPSYYIVAGGSTNVTLNVLRLSGTHEDMKVDRIALEMANVAATSTPDDLAKVTIWDGATKVGEAIFAGTRFATSTLTGSVIIPANGFKVLTVKGDISAIGTGQAGDSGVLLEIEYDGNDTTGTRAVGQSSGSTINQSSSSDTDGDGVRMFRAYPTVAQLTLPSTTLTSGNAKELHRFSVTASNHGLGIALNEFTLGVATSTGSDTNGSTTVEHFDVYAYTDAAFSNVVSGYTDGLVYDGTDAVGVSGNGSSEGTIAIQLSSPLNIAAGQTVYFKVVGDITFTTGTTNHGSHWVTTRVHGDAAFTTGDATLMVSASNAGGDTNNDFIWSPNSTTTQTTASEGSLDWTNGYGVPGLPSAGLPGNTLSK